MAIELSESHANEPWLHSFRSSKSFIVFVVSYAVFLDQFAFAVIIPVIPFALEEQCGILKDSVQYWVSILFAVYGATGFAVSPLFGWYIDRNSSRRTPFLFSLVVILCATLTIWRAESIELQMFGRILQGGASSFVWITGLAVIADTVGQENVGHALGYLSMAMMIGTLISPIVGGVVFARVSYDAVFYITLGLFALDILLRFVMIERGSLDQKIYSDEEGNQSGSVRRDNPNVGMSIGERAAREHYARHSEIRTADPPLVSLHQPSFPEHVVTQQPTALSQSRLPAVLALLGSQRLISALLGALVEGAINGGLETVLPLQTEAAFGWNSEGGGLIFLPLTITSFLGPAVGIVSDKFGARWPVCLGFLMRCPFLILLRLANDDTLRQKILLCVFLTLIGCCTTFTFDPLMAEIAYVVERRARENPNMYGCARKAYAQAFSLFSMAYSLGDTVGPIMAGMVRDEAGWGYTTLTLGLLSGITAIPVALWCGGWIGDRSSIRL